MLRLFIIHSFTLHLNTSTPSLPSPLSHRSSHLPLSSKKEVGWDSRTIYLKSLDKVFNNKVGIFVVLTSWGHFVYSNTHTARQGVVNMNNGHWLPTPQHHHRQKLDSERGGGKGRERKGERKYENEAVLLNIESYRRLRWCSSVSFSDVWFLKRFIFLNTFGGRCMGVICMQLSDEASRGRWNSWHGI